MDFALWLPTGYRASSSSGVVRSSLGESARVVHHAYRMSVNVVSVENHLMVPSALVR